jgi:diguanylate cyclase (GGDEF)-like protein
MTDELDLLPVGVLRLDGFGTILAANRVAGVLVGVDPSELPGRNILDFNADGAERAAAMLSFSADLREPMGPVPVRYFHADGTLRQSDLWAENHLQDPDIGAIVVVLVPEASTPGIAAAQSSVAEGAPIDTTLTLLAQSLRAHPFAPAVGCWLIRDEHGRRLVGADDLPESTRVALATSGMWWSGLHQMGLVDVADVSAETDEHHGLLAASGIKAWWLMPVPTGITGTVDAGVMVLRRTAGTISPNQTEHLGRIVTTAGLAFERAAMQARLSHAAFHDALTGVGNRERFFERSETSFRAGSALLYLDLDQFKPINDEHGHSTGDLVLVTVADRLRHVVRPTDRITRMGGDEFVIECPGTADDDEAIAIAERVIAAVQRPIELDDVTVEVGVSVGIARTSTEMPIDALLERSDLALYAAKRAGRGRWHVADPDGVTPAGPPDR